MVQIKTKVYNYSADEKIIGAEVIVYDEDGDKIKSIVVVDETEIQELRDQLDSLDENYVDHDELTQILTNTGESITINATTLNGVAGDQFVLESSLLNRRMTPTSHSSSSTTYGRGSKTLYGHNKCIDDLTHDSYSDGESLAAHQGYVLNEKIDALTDVSTHQLHSKFMLAKRNGTVQLTIEDWDGDGWVDGREGWIPIFSIPEGYRPAALNSQVKNIYCPNLFGYHLRVRVNITSNEVQVWSDGSDDHLFYGTVTWITYE
ncbi:MAG: hypothetical protein IJF83_05850 [Methanobrevibacter sp.]|nr:hypothetical protein [Methanobrevibacter sp.]